MTSAPNSAMSVPQNGPATIWASSSTRMPSSGRRGLFMTGDRTPRIHAWQRATDGAKEEGGMRRRTFLNGLSVGALLVTRARVWAQSSILAEGQPSRTAQGAATLRAAHQLVDRPTIFDDPLALRIIGPQAEASVRANLGRGPFASVRPFVAVRSRYA